MLNSETGSCATSPTHFSLLGFLPTSQHGVAHDTRVLWSKCACHSCVLAATKDATEAVKSLKPLNL